MELKRVKGLGQVTNLKYRAHQTEMATLLAREASLRRNLADLVSERDATAAVRRSSDDPALIAGALIRWHAWVDQRRATINGELAQVLAKKAECAQRLRHAFGKDQVAQALIRQVQSAEMRRRQLS